MENVRFGVFANDVVVRVMLSGTLSRACHEIILQTETAPIAEAEIQALQGTEINGAVIDTRLGGKDEAPGVAAERIAGLLRDKFGAGLLIIGVVQSKTPDRQQGLPISGADHNVYTETMPDNMLKLIQAW